MGWSIPKDYASATVEKFLKEAVRSVVLIAMGAPSLAALNTDEHSRVWSNLMSLAAQYNDAVGATADKKLFGRTRLAPVFDMTAYLVKALTVIDDDN